MISFGRNKYIRNVEGKSEENISAECHDISNGQI